ncbi:MAG: hypothetical protein C4340_04230, partial [Armatimonadota bacterium]
MQVRQHILVSAWPPLDPDELPEVAVSEPFFSRRFVGAVVAARLLGDAGGFWHLREAPRSAISERRLRTVTSGAEVGSL